MATKKKLLQAAAGAAAGGAALNVEDVFSTYLYTGTGAAQTITNGLDLAGEGGLVWHKARENATNNDHSLFDSETYTGSTFPSIQKAWESNVAGSLAARTAWTFNSDGFTTTASDGSNGTDQNGIEYVTWSFRKCPKFFDVVNYTGDGTSGRTISHNLGAVPAMIIIMGPGDHWVYHKDVGNTKYLELNKTTAEQTSSSAWNNTTPTDSVFTVGNGVTVNYSGQQYTAFIFAHNNSDGEFGPTEDQDIIKCGTWTGTGSVMDINLGFEPQWIMYKRTDATGDWEVFDNMRGLVVGGSSNSTGQRLMPNNSDAEGTTSPLPVVPTPTGFRNESSFHYTSGRKFIYIAIRRGPMAVPESATDVFKAAYGNASGEPAFTSNFPVDFGIWHGTISSANENRTSTRLTQGKTLDTDSDAAEQSSSAWAFDYQDGFMSGGGGSSNFATMWRRAPNFFDVVCYKGNGLSTGHDISHNLGAVPEMIWVKNRETASQDWYVYHKDIGNTHYLRLNATSASVDSLDAWNDTTPTDSVFTVGGAGDVNWNNANHIAYLFTSLDGISKVGSYTGNGSSQTIDCGFSSGARFVLIRGYDSASNNWWVFDSERGIVAGNDGYLRLNEPDAEVTSYDPIDPHSSGFIVNNVSGGSLVNYSGRNYIFYAIA